MTELPFILLPSELDTVWFHPNTKESILPALVTVVRFTPIAVYETNFEFGLQWYEEPHEMNWRAWGLADDRNEVLILLVNWGYVYIGAL